MEQVPEDHDQYITDLYFKEFDKQWKTFSTQLFMFTLVEAVMACHLKTIEYFEKIKRIEVIGSSVFVFIVDSQERIEVNGPSTFGLLLESLERNDILVANSEVFIPAMVHDVYRVVPSHGKPYIDALREMVESGKIPQKVVDDLS
jgi:hypothetical protein